MNCTFPRAALAALLAGGLSLAQPAGAPAQEPEDTSVTLGITLATATFLPIWLAEEEGFFADEGLDVEVMGFRGGSDLTRALVAGSVDIAVASPASVIAALEADQEVRVFYGGFNMTPFEWYARPGIETVEDLRGARIGITRYGSSTDVLTRMVLASGGLDPETDVHILQGGGSAERLAALEAGQIDAGPFASPHTFMAADRGLNLIARQSDFMPDYPVQSFYAMQTYIDAHPGTIRAVLRAFVRAVRLANDDRDRSIQTLVSRAGLEEDYAGRVYDEMIDGFREDGRLASEAGLEAFFAMGIATGEFSTEWPVERYWIDTFRATFDEWSP